MIKDVAFTAADIKSKDYRGGMNVITVNLTTEHGIVSGDNVYLEITTNTTSGNLAITKYNTVVKGDDAANYELGTGCTINLD